MGLVTKSKLKGYLYQVIGSVMNDGPAVKRCVLQPPSQGQCTGLGRTNAGEWVRRVGCMV